MKLYISLLFLIVILLTDAQAQSNPSVQSINCPIDPPTVENVSRCGTGDLILTATPLVAGQEINWYKVIDDLTSVFTGENYPISNLSESVTYYAEAKDLATGCASARVAVKAVINAIPNVPDTIGAWSCGPSSLTLKVGVLDGHTADWYDVSSGAGDLAQSVLTYTLPNLESSKTLYAASRDLVTGCLSARVAVKAVINAIPNVPDTIGAWSCGPSSLTLKVGVLDGHTADWYDVSSGAGDLAQSVLTYTLPNLESSKTLYAASRDLVTGCLSARVAVKAVINAIPNVPDTIGAWSCGPSSLTLKVGVLDGHTADWYDVSSGAGDLAQSVLTYTLPNLESSKTLYAASRDLVTGCLSARVAVKAVINDIPADPKVINFSRCGPGSILMTSEVKQSQTVDWFFQLIGGSPINPGSNEFLTPALNSSVDYYFQSRDLITGCISPRIKVNAVVNPLPDAPFATDTARCQPGILQLTAVPAVGSTVDWFSTNSGGNVLTGGVGTNLFNTPIVSNNTNFYAQARNLTTGCLSATRTAVLARIDAPSVSGTITGEREVCSGINNTALLLNAQRGSIQWQQSVDNSTFTDIQGANQSVFNAIDLITTTYYRVSIKNGTCNTIPSASVKMIVSQPSAAGIISGMKAVCAENNTTVLKVTGTNGVIQWQASTNRTLFTDIPGANADSLKTVNLIKTTYYRVIAKNGSCVNSASPDVTLTVNPLPQAPITQDGSRCGTGQIILRAFPPTGISNVIDWYTDSIPGIGIPLRTASNLFITPSVTNDTYFYAQTRNRITQCVSNERVAALAEIIPFAKTGSVAGDTIVCAGINQVVLKISGQEGRIQWQNSIDNVSFKDIVNAKTDSLSVTNLMQTSYYRVLLNADNGCNPSVTDTFRILAPNPSFAGLIEGVKEVCAGVDSVKLSLIGFNGAIQWQSSADSLLFNDISLANDSILSLSKLTQSTFYRVRLQSGICAPDTGDIVKVIVNELPLAPISDDVINCKIGSVELNASVPSGITTDWYAESTGGNILNRGQSTGTYLSDTLSSSTNYFVEARNLSTGCLSTTRTKVNVLFDPASIPIISGDPGLCNGDSILLKTDQTYGLQWFFNGDVMQGSQTPSIVIRKFGEYKVSFTNKSGCSNESAVKTVLGYPDILGSLVKPEKTDICDGYPFLLSASGSFAYQWYKNGVKVQDSLSSSYLTISGGVYTVQYISDKGCKIMDPDSIKLRLIKSPDAKYAIGPTTCINIPVEFINKSVVTESGNVIFNWEFGNGKTDTGFVMNHVYVKPGLYMTRLVVTPTSCIMLADTALMYVKVESPFPDIRYPAVNAVLNKSIRLEARDFGAKYIWTPSTGLTSATVRNPETKLTQQQDYLIAITTAAGCTTIDSLLVRVFRENDIMVPEGFSPNSDGQNDRLYPFLIGIRQMNMFRVYDRWGNLMFDNKLANSSTGWEGFYKGNPLPAGPYVWMAEGIDVDDKVIRRSGSVVLIR